MRTAIVESVGESPHPCSLRATGRQSRVMKAAVSMGTTKAAEAFSPAITMTVHAAATNGLMLWRLSAGSAIGASLEPAIIELSYLNLAGR